MIRKFLKNLFCGKTKECRAKAMQEHEKESVSMQDSVQTDHERVPTVKATDQTAQASEQKAAQKSAANPDRLCLADGEWTTWYDSLEPRQETNVDILVADSHLTVYFPHEQRLSSLARLNDDGTVSFRLFYRHGYMGDEDGFGVEPDEYLSAIVAPDGRYVHQFLPL